jgi:ElaB/YqjD/DUF883 family membrane-anchored ribosome-binding protein
MRNCGGHADTVRAGTDKVMADFRLLASDMEQLLAATANQGGQQVAAARARAEDSLEAARIRIAALQADAMARTRAASKATDDYVHANPWRVMALCGVGGLMLGSLLARGDHTHD